MLFRLQSTGDLKGNFVITSKLEKVSIGDYVELYLKEAPRPSGETIQDVRGMPIPVIDLNIRITFCCDLCEFDATMKMVPGRSLTHWLDCLEIGKVSKVSATKFTYRDITWYMPKIDGYGPGLYGKVKA